MRDFNLSQHFSLDNAVVSILAQVTVMSADSADRKSKQKQERYCNLSWYICLDGAIVCRLAWKTRDPRFKSQSRIKFFF